MQALPEEKRSELLERELWVEANYTQYKTEQEDEMKIKLASSSKYKMYRLVLKDEKIPSWCTCVSVSLCPQTLHEEQQELQNDVC